jgi:hypothetical protein
VAAGVLYFSGYLNFTSHSGVGRTTDARGEPVDIRNSSPEVVPAGGFLDPPEPTIRPVVVLITVSSRCDLQIVADGRQVLARSMDAGEWLEVGLSEAIELLGDDAGAVQLAINGLAGRALGQSGEPLAVRLRRDDYERFLVNR